MITVTKLGSVHIFTTYSDGWVAAASPRQYHYLAYQLTSRVSHYFEDFELHARPDSLLFLNASEPYRTCVHEHGDSFVIAFAAENMPKSFLLDCASMPQILNIYKNLYSHRHFSVGTNYYICMSGLYELFGIIKKQQGLEYYTASTQGKISIIHRYISEHFDDAQLDCKRLSQLAGMSERYLRKLFAGKYGCSPYHFLLETRIHEAEKLLSASDLTISQIAERVGFESAYYFSRVFKEHLAISPSDYRHGICDDSRP